MLNRRTLMAAPCAGALIANGGVALAQTKVFNPLVSKGFFAANEGSAIGVVNAIRETGTKGVIVIGYDSGAAQKAAVKEGIMAGPITQSPVGMGHETVKAAIAATKGEPLPKVIDSGFAWWDATNMDSPEIAAVLYD